VPEDDATVAKARSLCPSAIAPLRIHPDAAWPDGWQRVTLGREEWAYNPNNPWPDWVLIKLDPTAKIPKYNLSGSFRSWGGRLSTKVYEAEQGGAVTTTPKAAPEPSQRPSGPPPAPGVGRAKWIGDRIAAMTGEEDSGYLPHTRRRIAAHRALSIVAGYTPEDAENDGCLLPGGLLLHLEGLNALAARAFAGQEA
jgi:hypothetical protein